MQVKNICTLTTKQRNDIVFEKHGNATNKKKRNDEAILKHTKVQIVSIYKKRCTGKRKTDNKKYTYELLHTTEQE